MAHETNCPACGAPLEYSGNQDVVTCGFCGAKLEVQEDESGQTRFRVLEKPELQQDVLSNPIGSVDITSGEPVRPDFVDAGEPVAPGYISSVPDDATFEAASPTNIGATIYPGGTTASETPAHYQVGNEAQTARPAGPGRWIAIGAAVFVAVCLMCACAAGALIAISRGGGFQF